MANAAAVLGPVTADETAEICQHALAIVVLQAGGKLKITARDLNVMPKGMLAYAFQPDGSVEFAYVRE